MFGYGAVLALQQGGLVGCSWDRLGMDRAGQEGCDLHGDQCDNSALFHNCSNHFNLDTQLHLNNIYM